MSLLFSYITLHRGLNLTMFNNKFLPFELPREKAADINTYEDFNFVKKLIKIK